MEKVKARTGIYHEQQQGALCAQHALNNLLQNQFFTADDLAAIARELDVEELNVLTNASNQSENMDDTGFFNIQVLQRALTMFDIELVPIASQEPIAKQARSSPLSIQAYICNLGLHWFTIRRFARQYFNLNSIYYVPELIPDELLLAHLNLVEENGYSVFIVNGNLLPCIADEQLAINPVGLAEYRVLTKDLPKMIIDDKVIGTSKDAMKNGKLLVKLSPEVYREFEKNPHDPHIRKMILDQLPEGFTDADLPEKVGSSTSQQSKDSRRVILSSMAERRPGNQLTDAHDSLRKRRILFELPPNVYKKYEENPHDPYIRKLILDHLPEGYTDADLPEQVGYPNPQQLKDSRPIIFISMPERGPGNQLTDAHDSLRKRQLLLELPPKVYKRYEQNPHDPYIRKLIGDNLPEGFTDADLPEQAGYLNSQQLKDSRPIILISMSERGLGNQLAVPCGCPHCRQNHAPHPDPLVSDPFEDEYYDDIDIDQSNRLYQDSPMITRGTTQILIARSNPNNPNSSSQPRNTATALLIMTQSSHTINPSVSDQTMSRRNLSRRALETDDEFLLQRVMAQSLGKESMMDDMNYPFLQDQSEQAYQQTLDEAIAASLHLSDSARLETEQAPEIIPMTPIDSSPTPTTNSEPITIKLPSSLSTSPPSTNTHSLSLKNISSPSPNASLSTPTNPPLSPAANVSLPPPTNIFLPPPTNTPLTPPVNSLAPLSTTKDPPPPPAVTNSPAPTLMAQNSEESASIDELRQRRLKNYGNRDRSIISAQSNFDD